MPEKLDLQANVPAIVSLAYDDGLDVQGYHGDQVLYTVHCEDGKDRSLYTPPHVRHLLSRAGIGRGEPFRIGKFTNEDGVRKGMVWKVQRMDPEEPSPTPAQLQGGAPRSDQRTDRPQSTRPGLPASTQRPVQQPAPPQPAPPANGTNGRPAPQPPQTGPQPQPAPATPATQPAVKPRTRYADALMTVVGAVHQANQYAAQLGYQMPPFSAEDIRTMANTLIMNSERNGGAR